LLFIVKTTRLKRFLSYGY